MDIANSEKKLTSLSFYQRAALSLIFLLSVTLLTACGGGGGGGGESGPLSGTFIDAPVQGLDYATDTQDGTTNVQGTFWCETGEMVTFTIGDVVLGSSLCKSIITPQDLVPGAQDEMHPAVTNILRLVQSLDEDGDPDNGIFITPAIAAEVDGRPINFSESVETFDNAEIADLFNALNGQGAFSGDTPRSLRSPEMAQEHFRLVMGDQPNLPELAASFTVAPDPVIVLEPASFDASASTGNITEYLWDFGDDETGTGVETSHAFSETTTYLVTLTVRESGGNEDSITQEVVVVPPPNEPPVAQLTTVPETPSGAAPFRVSFVANTSYDPDGQIVSYAWDYGDGKGNVGSNASHTYKEPGTYTAKLTVTDNDGATSEKTVEITATGQVGNISPIASFTATPLSGEAPLQVSFNGSASSDPDGFITTYSWNFGDGQISPGAIRSHTYMSAGIYEAVLTVTDNDDAMTSSEPLEIIVTESGADCSTNNPCDENATCFDGGALIICSCNTGWTGNGYTCTQSEPDCENGDTLPDGGSACGLNDRGEFGQICVNGFWQNNTNCTDPDVCSDGSIVEGTGTCGLNGNGTLIQQECIAGQWTDSDDCNDPDVCTNGNTLPDGGSACGLNDRGEFGQSCVDGAWQDTEECTDPDECVDDSVTDGSTACGLNGNGTLFQECVAGQLTDSDDCDDPDVCTNNDTREGTTPCTGGFYMQLCENGQWGDTMDCSTFEDADGDLVGAADDPDDGDYTVCGDSDSDGCDDCSVSGTFDPANDGWDENGDGACELPLDYDCMNGANAASDPYRLQACIMFTFINQDRALFAEESGDAAPIAWNEDIWEVAVAHSIDMCQNVFYDHVNLSGQQPWDRAEAAGISFSGWSENIDKVPYDPQASQHRFMEEPTCVGHRKNILDPKAIEMGIGYYICDNEDAGEPLYHGLHFITQDFKRSGTIPDSAYCSTNTCQIPSNPPTSATCPANLFDTGWCKVPSADTLTRWGCD